jgi:hypothetical protein
VGEFKQSGKTQNARCKEQSIPFSTFQYHLKKFGLTHKQFIELQPPRRGLKLYFGKVYIELDPNFDERTLRRFLRAVGSEC